MPRVNHRPAVIAATVCTVLVTACTNPRVDPAAGPGVHAKGKYDTLCVVSAALGDATTLNGSVSTSITTTVGEVIPLIRAQTAALRQLMPLTDAIPQVQSGAEIFADGNDASVAALQRMPTNMTIVDAWADPRMAAVLDTASNAVNNTDFQSFNAWLEQTCSQSH